MKQRCIRAACCAGIVILLALQIWVLRSEGFSSVRPHQTTGKVIVHQSESVPRSKITQFLVNDDRLYILYDDVGLVNVYTTDGIFEYGIQVSSIANDRGDIAFSDGKLLIKARGAVIYVFDGTSLEQYVAFSASQRESSSAAAYKDLKAYFDLPKNHSTPSQKFMLSDQGTVLLEAAGSGLYAPVDFLPQRNELATVIPFLFAGTVIALLTTFQQRAHAAGQ